VGTKEDGEVRWGVATSRRVYRGEMRLLGSLEAGGYAGCFALHSQQYDEDLQPESVQP